MSLELDHELVFLVDGQDAAGVQVSADRVHGYHFLPHAQFQFLPSLNMTDVPVVARPAPAPAPQPAGRFRQPRTQG
jgi:hypothetical protein